MKTAKIKQAVLNKLDNMTDDELIEVYLNSLKSQMIANASNETVAKLLARVSQLELQVSMLQAGANNSPYRNNTLPTVSPINTGMNTWPPNPFRMQNYEEGLK